MLRLLCFIKAEPGSKQGSGYLFSAEPRRWRVCRRSLCLSRNGLPGFPAWRSRCLWGFVSTLQLLAWWANEPISLWNHPYVCDGLLSLSTFLAKSKARWSEHGSALQFSLGGEEQKELSVFIALQNSSFYAPRSRSANTYQQAHQWGREEHLTPTWTPISFLHREENKHSAPPPAFIFK